MSVEEDVYLYLIYSVCFLLLVLSVLYFIFFFFCACGSKQGHVGLYFVSLLPGSHLQPSSKVYGPQYVQQRLILGCSSWACCSLPHCTKAREIDAKILFFSLRALGSFKAQLQFRSLWCGLDNFDEGYAHTRSVNRNMQAHGWQRAGVVCW